jgi:holo-[acyl-carrier protein] synthase
LDIRLGTDIVHIPRISALLARFGDRFLRRVYTPIEQQEQGYPSSPADELPPTALSSTRLAGRWAAKEAVVKALGTGWSSGVRYTDVEIRRQVSGAPSVTLYGTAANLIAARGRIQWQLSLSHDGDYAIAMALLIVQP